MTLQDDAPRRFVKHIVRRGALVARQATSAVPSAASSTALPHGQIARTQTSSLEAPVVAIMLGGFIGTFMLFVLIGVTCKFANRPRSDNRRQPSAKAMYQPSAAGFGSAAAGTPNATFRGNDSMHDVSSPGAGLLTSAQPMGSGGRYQEAADDSLSFNGMDNGLGAPGPNGGYGMMPSHSASSFSGDESQRFGAPRRGHARGASSGIELPGPTASATFRRNVSGSHPPIHSNGDDSYESPHLANGFASTSVVPDGSGITPGQIFDHHAYNGVPSKSPNDVNEHRNSYLDGPPAGVLPRRASLAQGNPQQRPYPRGPPPASSNNRRSRYHQSQTSGDQGGMRRGRIDSVGPGTYRKSMFMSQDSSMDFQNGSQMRRTFSKTDQNGPKPLRRVESIGKGDPRRSSRFTSNNRANVPSMLVPEEHTMPAPAGPGGYRDGLPAASGDALLSVGAQRGWDGTTSPYSGSSNGSSSPLGPLGPNDPMLTMQQQQQQQYMAPAGGVRMMPYGAGFGAPMPRPGLATNQVSSPAAPLGAGLGRGMEARGHAASRQIL